ncbi:MAG: YggT family protein [Gammaproteobacteria bacterium]|jgi:YggT family protein|nr:YggT family protein [Gammaproteobacteria bacterium]
MNNALTQVLLFLTNTVFSLYIAAVVLRFLLQLVKADFYNPFCQFLMKCTNFVLLPLRRVIPGWFGLDIASLVLMLVLQIANLALIQWLLNLPITGWIVAAAAYKLLLLVLNLYFYAIFLRAILSWVNPYQNNPMQAILIQLTEPVLRPVRALIKPIHGFDLSPVLVIILIQALLILLHYSI